MIALSVLAKYTYVKSMDTPIVKLVNISKELCHFSKLVFDTYVISLKFT